MTPDPTTAEGLEAILPTVRDAAGKASRLVHAGYRRRMKVEHKGAVDLVTSYDRDSETLIRSALGEALPFPIIGEEQGGVDVGGAARFYVDPIDGTTNFVHGHPFWCVSIGLVVADRPALGVVVSPPLGIEWYGWSLPDGRRKERPTFVENAMMATEPSQAPRVDPPCTVSPVAGFADSLLATGFPYDRFAADNNFDAFVTIKRRCQAVRRCGSAALDLCLVADGTYEGYWERKLNPWDIAGGIALVLAAGGRVTDFDAGQEFMATGHVVATNGAIHEALLHELQNIPPITLPPARP